MRLHRVIFFLFAGGCSPLMIDCGVDDQPVQSSECPNWPKNGQPCQRYDITCITPTKVSCFCGSDLTWYCDAYEYDLRVPDLAKPDLRSLPDL